MSEKPFGNTRVSVAGGVDANNLNVSGGAGEGLGRPRAPTGVFREVSPGGISSPQAAKGIPGGHRPWHGL